MVNPLGKHPDPETGYISYTWPGADYGPDVRCVKCGGRAMWPGNDVSRAPHLCLRCADDWSRNSKALFKKHGFVSFRNRKKWDAAFKEFCEIPPTEVDIEAHNKAVNDNDAFIVRLAGLT